MQAHIRLGRIFGVRIGLHYSWILIALLITFSLAGHFRGVHPDWSTRVVWMTAGVTALLFFVGIVVHELSHALVAKGRGLPVRSITLFALGGVAQIGRESADAKTEFWMGIIGPITSAVIGLVCLWLASVLGWTLMTTPETPLLAMLVWLGYINIALALFNMIPGFPLDGGRVLRAILWWATGHVVRATRIASRVGQFVAFSFIILGIFRFFAGGAFGGLWLAFIGWFLLEAAGAGYAQVEMSENLRGLRVDDVMVRDCPMVESDSSLQAFVDEHLFRTGRRCYLITERGRVEGLITLNEVKGIDRARWPTTRLKEAMRPLGQLRTVAPSTQVSEALEILTEEDVNQLPVMSDGHLEGMISRDQILRILAMRAELNM